MKNKSIILLFCMTFIACMIDIFSNAHIALRIAGNFLISPFIFYLGFSGYKLNRRKGILLFTANVLMLIFTARYKIYLFNILLLSYLVWSIITPPLAKYKHIVSITVVTAFIAVYACSLLSVNIPLFTIVFYPAFLLGCIARHTDFENTPTARLKMLINILVSAAAFGVLLFKVIGFQIMDSITFLEISKVGSKTAVYLPFIAISFIWLSLSLSLFLFTAFGRLRTNTYAKEKNNVPFHILKTDMLRTLCFLFVIGLLELIGEYTLQGDLNLALRNVLDPHAMFNMLFLSSVYLTLIVLLGQGLSTFLLLMVALVLSMANFIKLKYFDEPFYPWDTYLIRNAISISKEYIDVKSILLCLLGIIISVLLIYALRTHLKNAFRPAPQLLMLPVVVCLTAANYMILNNTQHLSDLHMQKSWYIGKVEAFANGLYVQNYFYLADYKKYVYSKPQDYSYESMAALSQELESSKPVSGSITQKPNVIVIMSESYWDPTQLKGITFSQDITKNLRKLQKGVIASPAIGGGTANTEFEALTGLSMYFLNPGVVPYNVYLRRETPSIASVFKDNGYRTIAVHPNQGSFYNRDKVYKFFGFEDFIDIKGFDHQEDAKGPHVSDEKVIDKILDVMKTEDTPCFIFAVTMQNHDPYLDKYKNLEVIAQSDKLNEKEINIFSGYAQGIYDADRSLGKLIDALSKEETPTLVYFFGDHLPRLGSLQDLYDICNKLNPFENKIINKDTLWVYQTPFAAWSNFMEIPPPTGPISPIQIANTILKDSHVSYPSYFTILERLQAELPVLHKESEATVDVNNPLVSDYWSIQYDLLFGDQYLLNIK